MQAEEPVPVPVPVPPPTRQHQNGMLGEFIVNKKSPYPNVAHSTQQGGGCGPTLQGEQSRLPPTAASVQQGVMGFGTEQGQSPDAPPALHLPTLLRVTARQGWKGPDGSPGSSPHHRGICTALSVHSCCSMDFLAFGFPLASGCPVQRQLGPTCWGKL